jgi:hypothetical protein
VKQELLIPPVHLSSPPVFSGVRVSRSLVLCVCFVDRCLSFFFCPLCCLSLDLRIMINLRHLKTLLKSVRPHNWWWHHEGKHIVVDTHYYNTTYNTTCSVVRCGRFSNAVSLTSDIVLLFMVLKYSFTLNSSIIIDIPALS